jgi:hypothetical protein
MRGGDKQGKTNSGQITSVNKRKQCEFLCENNQILARTADFFVSSAFHINDRRGAPSDFFEIFVVGHISLFAIFCGGIRPTIKWPNYSAQNGCGG